MPKDIAAWTKEIEASVGRSLTRNEHTLLDGLTELLETIDWRDTLYAKDVAALIPETQDPFSDPQAIVNNGLWSETPEDEYSLWQYIAYILDSHDIAIPPFLEPHTQLDPIKQAIAERDRSKRIKLWSNRLGNLSQGSVQTEHVPLSIRIRLQGRQLKWETRTPDQNDYQPIQAQVFSQWLSKGYGYFERFAPDSITLAALFWEYYQSSQRARIDLDKPEDCAFLNKLIHNPDTFEQIVDKDGDLLHYDDRRLRYLGVEDGPDAQRCYQLKLGFEDGEPAPLPIIYLPGSEPLYLHADTLFRGPAMLRPDENPNNAFAIPDEALESPEGLLFLRNSGLPLPEKLKDSVVIIPLQPALYCKVETTAKGQDFLARFLAIARDQRYWFHLTSDGWQPCDNAETNAPSQEAPTGALFEYPNGADLIERLERFDLDEDEPGEWRISIDHTFPQKFVAWLSKLPSSLQIVADDELDTLVDSKPSGRYALQVESSDHPDWFNISLKPEMIDTSLTEEEAKLVMQGRGEYIRLPGKGWKRFDTQLDSKQTQILDTIGVPADEADKDVHAFHALQLSENVLEEQAFEEHRKLIKRRAREISAHTPESLPKGISATLRPYQVEGFKFLSYLSQNQFGGILADDMGLGKTLQTLTWLTWLKHRHPEEEPFNCLVICPKSVMHVWKREVSQFASQLQIAIFDPAVVNSVSWKAADIDICVANYSQLRIQSSFFKSIDWTVCILDEGQYIKNPLSLTARTARSLKAQHRVVLTGTPVENRAMDLWSLFAFAMPGLLGSQASFKRQYKENDTSSPQRIARRVKHFMLRRSKKQVAPDLPDRIEETLVCQMEDEQKALYDAELKLTQQKLLQIKTNADLDKERFNILASLLRLRQICCHPKLVDPSYADARSAKLEALIDHVGELQSEGHKVLIFSQFVEMLDIISAELERIDRPYLKLTGKTQNREELVQRFQEDESVTAFLLSLRAAGSGLNLTAASYVFLYDPWWNPAVEAQAIDRTHRIGQKNAVIAYRLAASDTVEAKIQSLQLRKEELANEIVQEESLGNILNLENLRYVLGGGD